MNSHTQIKLPATQTKTAPKLELMWRPIKEQDDKALGEVLSNALIEFGYAVTDPMIYKLSQVYTKPGNAYWVLVDKANNDKIYGGCGFAKKGLPTSKTSVIQKFYFAPEIRELGYGKKLLNFVLQNAAAQYDDIQLVTGAHMQGAQALYKKLGFTDVSPSTVIPSYTAPQNPKLAFVGFQRDLAAFRLTTTSTNQYSKWHHSTTTNRNICLLTQPLPMGLGSPQTMGM
jgi:ribosomal protein S18 acetylase RimI-like enzyme